MALAGTQAVDQDATSVTVTGVFTLPYQVALQPNWVTAVGISSKSASAFTVDFSAPAPAGAMLDWFIINIGQPIGFAEVEIANLALSHISAQQIQALTEQTTQARLANAYFWPVADEALQEHPWNFALFRSPALAETAAPSFGDLTHKYQLPTEPYCLRVLSTDGDPGDEWAVEGRYILTAASSVKVKYIGRVTDTGIWSPMFISAYSHLLASKMAYPISKSRSLADDMFKLYQERLVRARSNNGLEGIPRPIRSRTLLDVR